MRGLLISLLGGKTSEEVNKLLSEKDKIILDLKRNSFRVGDKVYVVGDNTFKCNIPYYLLEPYNGNDCWYISTDPKDVLRHSLYNGINFSKLSFDPHKKCPCCQTELI